MADTTPISAAKRIQQATGPTFHVATRSLPERVRHPTYVLYAYFRLADQVVDDPDPLPAAQQAERLETFKHGALGNTEPDHPVVAAMADLVETHGIDPEDIEAFIDAMASDIDIDAYDTYTDLEGYLRGSAVAVAYMMLDVMDPADPEVARPHARALGEAFQLTNFIRDVREDVVEFDRVYLPRSTLQTAGTDADAIRGLTFSPAVARVVATELERAEQRYHDGVAGIRYLPPDCRFPVLLAAVLYAEHHREIRRVGYNVIDHRPTIPTRRYPLLVARTWLHWKRLGDPAAVFYRASAIDRPRTAPQQSSTAPLANLVDGAKAHLPLSRGD